MTVLPTSAIETSYILNYTVRCTVARGICMIHIQITNRARCVDIGKNLNKSQLPILFG